MEIKGLDISKVPFSTRGSYMAVNYLNEDYYSGYTSCTGFSSNLDKMPFVSTPGLYLRSVCTKGQNNNMEMIRFLPVLDHRETEYRLTAGYSRIDLEMDGGKISMTFLDSDTLIIEGTGDRVGLKLDCITEGRSAFLVKIPMSGGDFYHKLTNHLSFDNYGIYVQRGKVGVDQEWEADHLLNTACVLAIEGEEGSFTCVIRELRTYIWPDAGRKCCFELAEQKNREAFESFYSGMPKAPAKYREAQRLAAYLCWSGVVAERGYIKRDTIFMTKNILCFVWAYESWLCAAALCDTDRELAYDQLMTMLDSQDHLGGLPNFKGDGLESYEANMPPNLGWVASLMMKKVGFSLPQLEELYQKMAAYTRFYLNYMDEDDDGVFEYHHGYDACGDDDTLFREELNISSPDLTTWMILQMDCLAEIAGKLRRKTEKKQWEELSERSLQGMVQNLFDENHLPFAKNNCTGGRIHAESPILFTPLMLGERLPAEIRAAIIRELKTKAYITEHGVASEAVDSKYYQPEGFFRGPIWFTMTLTTVEGLRQCKEEDLARELAVKYCDLVKNGGCAECYQALTGEPLNNKGYVSTAAVFLILLHNYL